MIDGVGLGDARQAEGEDLLSGLTAVLIETFRMSLCGGKSMPFSNCSLVS